MSYKIIHQFDEFEPIVSMIDFNGTILVATSRRVFKKEGDVFTQLTFEIVDLDPSPAPTKRLDPDEIPF